MLRQSKRISGKNRVSQILNEGGKAHSSFFVLRTLATNDSPRQRYAVVVGKKISTQAVTRNRTRRRIYEAIRMLEAQTTPTEPYEDRVLIARTGAIKAPFEGLTTDLKKILAAPRYLPNL